MARDYKKRSSKVSRKKTSTAKSPLTLLGAGFGLGIIAAFTVYQLAAPPAPVEPSRPVPTIEREPQSAVEVEQPQVVVTTPAQAPQQDERFDFYEMLPNFNVVIQEDEESVAPAAQAKKIDKPGAYVLQAGSFRNHGDADRMKATLALQGIESHIQKVTIDNDKNWHRVRIGPMTNLTKVNRLRTRLREADIDALLLRVAE